MASSGLDAILHTASPLTTEVDDPEDLIRPAVNVTLSILKSAIKTPGNIKRIIIFSSTVSVGIARTDPEYTEEDWNDLAVDDVQAKGKVASGFMKYSASKTLAERAAWKLYREHKTSLPWDLAAINPPYIFGPNLHEVDKPEHLNTSSLRLYNLFFKPVFSEQELLSGVSWVDVRDVAEAHVVALKKEAAGDERILSRPRPPPTRSSSNPQRRQPFHSASRVLWRV